MPFQLFPPNDGPGIRREHDLSGTTSDMGNYLCLEVESDHDARPWREPVRKVSVVF